MWTKRDSPSRLTADGATVRAIVADVRDRDALERAGRQAVDARLHAIIAARAERLPDV